ncbi:YciI family protein [Spongisporangium articulatum]|uniref:YciI family protein n=1 Tax=Spongisporangium articulatum TaxID=3362603 RepID=A0ABW8AHY5_9ACTN
MSLFVVTYTYSEGSTATRDEVRPAHREFLAGLPELVLSGPTDDDNALLLLDTATADAALALLDPDPFRAAGVIAERSVRGWNVVLGRARDRL